MSFLRKLGSGFGIIILAAVVMIEGLLIHEIGHGVTAQVLGGEFKALYVFPGVQVWPEAGRPYPGEWGLNVGGALIESGESWGDAQRGWMLLMGSGSTMLMAVFALLSLWIIRPGGWLAKLFIAEALLFLDMLFYTILPSWFGLPHWGFFGGTTPEPLIGAELLGISRELFILLILSASTLMTLGVVGYGIRLMTSGGDDDAAQLV